MVLLWVLGSYLVGAVPFSVWLGRLFLGSDVRSWGEDRNPGAANAWRAGTWKLGFPVLLLDFLKGVLPVWLAQTAGKIHGWPLVPVALAPLAGHAWPVFLGMRGGKALTVTFGVWTALTLPEGPFVLGGLFILFFFWISPEGWAVLLAMSLFVGFLAVRGAEMPLLIIAAANLGILAWKHRQDLRKPPRLRYPGDPKKKASL